MNSSRLLFPALRWHADTGFARDAALIDSALGIGVGGFIIFGGTAAAVAELTTELRRRSAVPLLVAADLERGAGQQFAGATPLPPLAALGSLDDPAITRRAAAITAREALALGVNWVYAPVADVDLDAANPIVGTRAFGTDPARVSRHVAAWVDGCRAEGVLACAKHFPGHGRTTEDSHAALPRVGASIGELQADLAPFRAAIAAGVDSIMTAHVVYDALDAAQPATLSHAIVQELLRGRMNFDGLVVTDALNMAGAVLAAGDERAAAVAALSAGCDVLLYPDDLEGVADALRRTVTHTALRGRVADALARIERAATAAGRTVPVSPAVGAAAVGHDRAWARAMAVRTVHPVRGDVRLPGSFDLLTIDDDVGGPYAPPERGTFAAALRSAGLNVRDVTTTTRSGRPLCMAVYADIRAWKERPTLSTGSLRRIEAELAECQDATLLLFGHPRLADELSARCIVVAWGGEPLMQEAAADWIAEAAAR